MNNLAEFIEFRNIGDKLILSCKGDFCDQETILGSEKSQSITIKKNSTDEEQEIIQGVFSLKYLSIFTKCTNLSNNVELYLKNNYPIIQRYTIATLGEIGGFSVEIFEKNKIEALKMGGLLAVNKGSIDPPTFTVIEYKPKNATNKKPVVLVGKGVVYDTGGLSLKPTASFSITTAL